MSHLYEVLFYDGSQERPGYFLIDGVDGATPEEALRSNLTRLTDTVRAALHLWPEFTDEKIHESLYVLRTDGLVSVRRVS